MLESIKVVIWGASGHAGEVKGILEVYGGYEIIGFLDDINIGRHGGLYLDRPILGGREQLFRLREEQGVDHVAMGIGQCAARLELGDFLLQHHFLPVLGIHPHAFISRNVEVDAGTIVQAGAIINSRSSVGRFSIINTAATIGHECAIGSGVHIGPGVNLAGQVRVGDGTWIGIGSCAIQSVRIGAGSMVGAGSVILKDIPAGVVAYGNPARVIRPVSEPF